MGIPASWFDETVKIERRSSTLASKEITTGSYSQITASEPVRIDPLGGDVRGTLMGRLKSCTHRLFVNPTNAPLELDRLTDSGGNTYIVQSVENLHGHHVECLIEEQKQ